MTRNHHAALLYIAGYIAEHGLSPSYDEIAEAIGRRPGQVGRYVAALEAEGYITRVSGKWRSIRLTEKGEAQCSIETDGPCG